MTCGLLRLLDQPLHEVVLRGGKPDTYTISLEFFTNDDGTPLEAAIHELKQGLGVTYEIMPTNWVPEVEFTGTKRDPRVVTVPWSPQGVPEVEFTGTKRDLLQLIRRYDGCDGSQGQGNGNFTVDSPDAEIWEFYHDGIG
jgi:hypothetical protein